MYINLKTEKDWGPEQYNRRQKQTAGTKELGEDLGKRDREETCTEFGKR